MCSESQSESCGKSSRCALTTGDTTVAPTRGFSCLCSYRLRAWSLLCFSIDCTLWLHLLDIAAALKVAFRIRPTRRARHAAYVLQCAAHRAPCVLLVHSLRRIRCVPESCHGLGVAKLSSGIMDCIASRARCLRLAPGCAFPTTYTRSSDLSACCMVQAAHRVLQAVHSSAHTFPTHECSNPVASQWFSRPHQDAHGATIFESGHALPSVRKRRSAQHAPPQSSTRWLFSASPREVRVSKG